MSLKTNNCNPTNVTPPPPPRTLSCSPIVGRVFAVEYEDGVKGPERVWLSNMNVPGLAMSRSLCDHVAHMVLTYYPILWIKCRSHIEYHSHTFWIEYHRSYILWIDHSHTSNLILIAS